MLASVLAFARDLARLGDAGLAFEPDLEGEGGTKISPGIGTGWVLFPVLPSICFGLISEATPCPSPSTTKAFRFRGLPEDGARYRECSSLGPGL